jgi:hypothetical protein
MVSMDEYSVFHWWPATDHFGLQLAAPSLFTANRLATFARNPASDLGQYKL